MNQRFSSPRSFPARFLPAGVRAPRSLTIGGAIAALLMSGLVHAQVVVQEPWARATVPTQRASGVFMHLKADQDMKLVKASSDVATHTEIHEMTHDNGVMKMREVDGIALPANQDVALAPGGLHVMLLDLKQQLKADDSLALDLTFEDAQGKRVTQQVTVPVRPLNAGAPQSGQGHGHAHGHDSAPDAAHAGKGHAH